MPRGHVSVVPKTNTVEDLRDFYVAQAEVAGIDLLAVAKASPGTRIRRFPYVRARA